MLNGTKFACPFDFQMPPRDASAPVQADMLNCFSTYILSLSLSLSVSFFHVSNRNWQAASWPVPVLRGGGKDIRLGIYLQAALLS